MRRQLFLFIYFFILLPIMAQTTVRDAQDGQPIIQASVYDEQGKIIGVTDTEGRLPDVDNSKAIRLTHIAYHPLDVQVAQIGNELQMHPVAYTIKPVVVESKKDTYCLKLTCYYRQYMVNGKGTADELPPVVSFVDGICNLYVFTDENKTTRRIQLTKRLLISNDMESSTTDEELPGITIHSFPERYKEAVDKSPYTFQQDSTRHVINTTFNALYPDKSRPVRLNILGSNSKYQTVASPTMVKNLHQAVHQRGPYAKVSQGDLLAYSEVRQLKGIMKQRGHEKYAMNLWLFDEYFPVEATFMTKQEYKIEQKALHKSSQILSPGDIDRYINEQNIPELSNDIQQKLEMTRKLQRTMTTSDAHSVEFHKDLPQERIYLQTDKPYYAAGDTVWLRAHLMDAETNEPVIRSCFVYVELHDQQADTLMQRMMIRCDEDGVFANALLLPKEIKGGVYTLVAYTQWMRNFPVEQFCYQPLTVVGGLRARGHRIPEELLSQYGGRATISGKAATNRSLMTLDINVHDKDSYPLSGIFALSVTDYDVVKPDSLFGDIRQSLLRQQLSNKPYTISDITYPYQEQQLITGCVKGTLKKNIKNPHLHVVNTMTGQQHEFELGDSTRFALAVENPEGCTYLLEATDYRGGTGFLQLLVDSLTFPQVRLPKYALSSIVTDTTTLQRMTQPQPSYDGVLLDEVVKIGTHRPIRSKISHKLGAPSFMLTEGHPKLKATRNVETVLRTMGVQHGVTDNGIPYLKALVYIVDGHGKRQQVSCDQIWPSDIKQLDMYRGFKSLKEPDIIVIQLKPGVMNRAKSKPNMVTVQQLGYSQPIEFYSPQYTDETMKTRPDHRTTLYWNPKVETDANGKATVRFYASDISKRYLVTLEGVSNDGTIVHQQQVIE